MIVVRAADARRTQTPNAVMTTLASPTQGGAGWAVWHTEMEKGARGPRHAFDAEQVWAFLAGGAAIEVGSVTIDVGAGDTVVLPPDVTRQVTAGPDGFTAVVSAPAGGLVYDASDVGDDCGLAPRAGERRTVPWAL